MLGRLSKRVRSLLQKEISIEKRVASSRQEREPFDISDEELIEQFRPLSLDIEEAKRSARQGRMGRARESLADHLRDRLRPKLFLHPVYRERIVEQLKSDEVPLRPLLKSAEDAKARSFSRLGQRKHFSSAIDWFTDFQDRSWIYGAKVDLTGVLKRPNEETTQDMGPVEATWLFNSLEHFVTMGRAYWLTGQETLVSEFVVQAVDWAERNPIEFGINWIDSVTIASRTVNWMLALNLFLASTQLHDEVVLRLLRAIVGHGAVLANIVEQDEDVVGGVAAASALCILSLFFPELKAAERWYELSSRELPELAKRCLGQDKLHISGSSADHRELIEWMLLPEILHRLNDLPSPKGLAVAIESACETLTLLMSPDRKACDLGANSGRSFLGQRVGATEHVNRVLALGAIATGRADFRPGVEMPSELWWWLGPGAESYYQGLEAELASGPKSHVFKDAGVLVVRDDWERQASWCLLRGTPTTTLLQTARPAPASIPLHDDALQLSLCLSGEAVFVEPGGPELTHLLQPAFARITAHTAPRVGREREPLCLERVSQAGEANVYSARLGGNAHYLAAYRQVWVDHDNPWRLWREVLFLPEARHVAIRDTLEGEGEVDFDTNLVLSPHLDILMRGDMGCLIRGKSLQARLVPIFPGRFRYSLKRGQQQPVAGWCYAGRQPVPTYCLRYFGHLQAPFSTYLWLVWDPNDTRVPRTEELDRQYDGVRSRIGLNLLTPSR